MTTKIEWCDETVNPIRARNTATGKVGWHCERVDEGCRHCYAAKQNRNGARGGTRLDYEPTHFDQGRVEVFLAEAVLAEVLGMRKPRAIFWSSMTDLFGRFVQPQQRLACIDTMRQSPQHQHIVLTKRIKEAHEELEAWAARAAAYYAEHADLMNEPAMQAQQIMTRPPLPNVYIGTSVSDQASADARLPDLLRIAALGWKVWVSYEPALGAVEWEPWTWGGGPSINGHPPMPKISGLVCGGESGGKEARPMHPDWPRAARDACAAAGVPFQFKQWGEWGPTVQYPEYSVVPVDQLGNERMARVGKKAAGRLLDGVLHDALPWRTP